MVTKFNAFSKYKFQSEVKVFISWVVKLLYSQTVLWRTLGDESEVFVITVICYNSENSCSNVTSHMGPKFHQYCVKNITKKNRRKMLMKLTQGWLKWRNSVVIYRISFSWKSMLFIACGKALEICLIWKVFLHLNQKLDFYLFHKSFGHKMFHKMKCLK